jgi:hypothetical protein
MAPPGWDSCRGFFFFVTFRAILPLTLNLLTNCLLRARPQPVTGEVPG